jgi:hypothetical protein
MPPATTPRRDGTTCAELAGAEPESQFSEGRRRTGSLRTGPTAEMDDYRIAIEGDQRTSRGS